MMIGLTGKNGCGKGAVVELLLERGWKAYSLSDVIRHEIRKSGSEPTRDLLIVTGTRLRSEGGPGVLAEKILELISGQDKIIVDSIRNPAEVAALRKREDFFLIRVSADQKIRFERCLKRNRPGDAKTFDEFVRHEQAELVSDDPAAQQLNATAELADVVIQNNGSISELQIQLFEVLSKKFGQEFVI